MTPTWGPDKLVPTPAPPKGGSGISRPKLEAGTFAPQRMGAMAASAREVHLVVNGRPGGIHAWLCRLGIHAWAERYEGTSYTMHQLRSRCACGAVRRG